MKKRGLGGGGQKGPEIAYTQNPIDDRKGWFLAGKKKERKGEGGGDATEKEVTKGLLLPWKKTIRFLGEKRNLLDAPKGCRNAGGPWKEGKKKSQKMRKKATVKLR